LNRHHPGPSGIFELNSRLISGSCSSGVFISVANGSGLMPLTVTFSGANSSASARVKPGRALLLDA